MTVTESLGGPGDMPGELLEQTKAPEADVSNPGREEPESRVAEGERTPPIVDSTHTVGDGSRISFPS